MDMKRSGSQPSAKRPAEYFTGTVRIDPLFKAKDPVRISGTRTAWHTYPLIVMAGCGLAQRWGGASEQIGFSPGEKYWHSATPTTAMMHIAIQEAIDGRAVDWMEKVSDEQYQTLNVN